MYYWQIYYIIHAAENVYSTKLTKPVKLNKMYDCNTNLHNTKIYLERD